MLNELETIDGQVWANVWMTDSIVRIDPATGNIASLLDLSTLKADAGASGTDSVLNGIAWDEKGKRSEEHTSELKSLMRNAYAVFCLTKKNKYTSSNLTKQ